MKKQSLNTKHYKKMLEERRDELQTDIGRLDEQARESKDAEVEDPIDHVESSENKTRSLEESTRRSEQLQMVEDALLRIEDGSYGFCLDCGEPIEEKRLEAVPWAHYCLKDQEKRDSVASPVDVGGSTI